MCLVPSSLLWWISGIVAEPGVWVWTRILHSVHIWAVMGVGRRWLGILEACWDTLLQVPIPFFTRVLVSSQFCQLAALQRVVVKSSHLLLPGTALWLFWRRQLFNSWSSAGCVYSQQMHCFCHTKGTRRTESAHANSMSSAFPWLLAWITSFRALLLPQFHRTEPWCCLKQILSALWHGLFVL